MLEDSADNTPPSPGSHGETGRRSSGGPSLLVGKGLSKTYRGQAGPVYALEEVDFEVTRGEVVAVVGRSGCGKTTLLNIVAGFILPDHGTVSMGGSCISGPGADRVMVFQEDALLPWLTVEGNVLYGLTNCGRYAGNSVVERCTEYLRLVGLADWRRAYPKELSGGMKKRVELARTFAVGPPVVLADEPFAGIDALTRVRLQEELLRICGAGETTILMATHDIREAVFLSQRVLLMSPGPRATIVDAVSVCSPLPRDEGFRHSRFFEDTVAAIAARLVKIESGSPKE